MTLLFTLTNICKVGYSLVLKISRDILYKPEDDIV